MGNVEKDKKIFIQKCIQCHTMDKGGRHKIEPKTGQAPGFSYTDANKNKGITWEKGIWRIPRSTSLEQT